MSRKKITKGAKGATAGLKAAHHLNPHHPIHEQDREQAAILRSRVFVEDPTKESKLPFTQEHEIGGVYAYVRGVRESLLQQLDKGAKTDSETGEFPTPELDEFYANIFRNRNFYFKKGNKKKDGSNYIVKMKTDGVKDNTLSLPKMWTKLLSEKLKNGELGADRLNETLETISGKLLKTLADRTGYEPLYAAIHPDTEHNLQFHFGTGSVDPETHCLLGRSASGKRGKQGLREAGFSFLNVWRHAKNAKLTEEEQLRFEERCLKLPKLFFNDRNTNWDGSEKKPNGGFDDVALATSLEELLNSEFPEFAKEVHDAAVMDSTLWARAMLANGHSRGRLLSTIGDLRTDKESLVKTVQFGKDALLETKKQSESIQKELMHEIETLDSEKDALFETTKKQSSVIQKFKKNPYFNKSDEEIKKLNDKLEMVDELRDKIIHLKKYPLDGNSEEKMWSLVEGHLAKLKAEKEKGS